MKPNETAAYRVFKALVPPQFCHYVDNGGRIWAISLWHSGVQIVEPITCAFTVTEGHLYYALTTERLQIPVTPDMLGRSDFQVGYHHRDGEPLPIPLGTSRARVSVRYGDTLALTKIGISVRIGGA